MKRRTFVSLLVYPADRTATLSGHEVGHDIDERAREGPSQEHDWRHHFGHRRLSRSTT